MKGAARPHQLRGDRARQSLVVATRVCWRNTHTNRVCINGHFRVFRSACCARKSLSRSRLLGHFRLQFPCLAIRAPQTATGRPRAPQSAPERPRRPQDAPERPRAPQTATGRPRAPQTATGRPHSQQDPNLSSWTRLEGVEPPETPFFLSNPSRACARPRVRARIMRPRARFWPLD